MYIYNYNFFLLQVIAKQELCLNLSEALLETHHNLRGYMFKLNVIQAENVSNILNHDKLRADFIVSIIDTHNPVCIREVSFLNFIFVCYN